jgi:hypothetical protein
MIIVGAQFLQYSRSVKAMNRFSVKERMSRSISLRKGEVVMRADFEKLGSASQLSRALKELTDDGKLVRLGYGVYAKTKPSSLSGRPVVRATPAELAQEVLIKLGVQPVPGESQEAYAKGLTNQVPMRTTFNTGNRRISRQLLIGRTKIEYENDYTV